MDPTEQFASLVAQDDVPLDAAALAMAAHAWPSIDVDVELSRLDELAGRLDVPTRDGLCRGVFGEAGLLGNHHNYYDPDNSFLNRVLDTGLGIPISLAVVMIEVGRRCGVTLTGINAPSHFLVRDESDGAYLDPFDGGTPVAADGPVTDAVGILARMLNNLRSIYVASGDISHLLWVLELRTLLPGAPPDATHELTRVRAKLN